jgi:hypothetical protein
MVSFYKGGDMSKLLIVTSTFVLIAAGSSYGYIDMSTGSYVVQLLLAGLLGGLYGFRGWIKKIVEKIPALKKKRKYPN